MPSHRESQQELPKPKDVQMVDVGRLRLDGENPRLAWIPKDDSETELLKLLWNEMAVNELVLSIAANGYFPQEPFLVIRENPKDPNTKFTVIEGNRRLAAVRILLDDTLRKKLHAEDMPKISAEQKHQLRQLPAFIYNNRQELWAYLGFRHINSPKPWDAFSKARYVAQVHERYRKGLKEIAAQIGDTHHTVERLYLGYKVFEQAASQTDFRLEDINKSKFYFSYLYTALQYDEFREFLGIRDEDVRSKVPVRKHYLPQLDELMSWLYGKRSKNTAPVIRSQNPDLNRLRHVLKNPAALSLLRSEYPLERAFEKTAGDADRFYKAIASAKEELEQAKATVATGYQGDQAAFGTLQDIEKLVQSLHSDMEIRLKRRERK